jgi:hypothetical protein
MFGVVVGNEACRCNDVLCFDVSRKMECVLMVGMGSTSSLAREASRTVYDSWKFSTLRATSVMNCHFEAIV